MKLKKREDVWRGVSKTHLDIGEATNSVHELCSNLYACRPYTIHAISVTVGLIVTFARWVFFIALLFKKGSEIYSGWRLELDRVAAVIAYANAMIWNPKVPVTPPQQLGLKLVNCFPEASNQRITATATKPMEKNAIKEPLSHRGCSLFQPGVLVW